MLSFDRARKLGMPRDVGAALIAAILTAVVANVGVSQDVDNLNLTPKKTTDVPAPKNDGKAIAVIERYLQAIGGREVLNAINDRSTEFDTIKHAPTGETTARLKLFVKRGFKIREEWDLPGFQISDKKLRFVQVYDGFDGWVQMFGTVSRLEGRTFVDLRLGQADRQPFHALGKRWLLPRACQRQRTG